MLENPAVSYRGGIPGYAATKPAKGKHIDPDSAKVVKYVVYLDSRHAEVLAKVGGEKLYDYHYSFNGFAAKLNPGQAAKLNAQPGVVKVSADELVYQDTSSTPAFLGLTASGGLWEQLGGYQKAGDGIIIGVIDSGIWPESL